jgi:hypothetical protein
VSPLKVPASPVVAEKASDEVRKAKAPQKPILLAQQAPLANKKENTPPILNDVTVPKQQEFAKAPVSQYKSIPPLNGMIIAQQAPLKKRDTSLTTIMLGEKFVKKPDTGNIDQVLQTKIPGVGIYNNNASPGYLSPTLMQANVGGLSVSQLLANQSIRNQVNGKDKTVPVPGQSINIENTLKPTQPDADGRLEGYADSSRAGKSLLSTTKQTPLPSANNRDSSKNAAAEANSSALSEEVVIGYTSQKKDETATDITYAHPQKGWSSLKKYLKENAVSPDGKTGVVSLSFTVDKYGSISGIKVTKGVSEATDKKAISLVKDGPEWTGNSNKEPEKVHLRIRFAKPAAR